MRLYGICTELNTKELKMYYHAEVEYGHDKKRHYWSNHSKDSIIKKLILPFINRQIIVINREKVESIFNLNSVTYITIFKTANKLVKKGKIKDEFSKSEIRKNDCTQELLNEIRLEKADKKTKSLLQQSFSTPENQIFVIMKFNDEILDSAYKEVIKPIGNEFGYKVLRIDEVQDSGKISDQVLENIIKSQIIIADLSGERPNCYYEAGFAHAIGKDIIFSIKRNEPVHFDLTGYRFIEWSTEGDFKKKLRTRLESMKMMSEK